MIFYENTERQIQYKAGKINGALKIQKHLGIFRRTVKPTHARKLTPDANQKISEVE